MPQNNHYVTGDLAPNVNFQIISGGEPEKLIPSSKAKKRKPITTLQSAILRASFLFLLCLSAIFYLYKIASPSHAILTRVNGQLISINVATPTGISNGHEIAKLPRVFPCSVTVNIGTRAIAIYSLEGELSAILAHEIGHCMERQLKEKSTIMPPATDSESYGWDKNTARSEAYADSWGSLYLRKCGLDIVPFGWPDQNEAGATTTGKALEEAQKCIPKPNEVKVYENPLLLALSLVQKDKLKKELSALKQVSPQEQTTKIKAEITQKEKLLAILNKNLPDVPTSFEEASQHRHTKK